MSTRCDTGHLAVIRIAFEGHVINASDRPQIAKFMGPTWGPPGSCRPQMGPILGPWILLSGTSSALDQTCLLKMIYVWHTVLHFVHIEKAKSHQVHVRFPYGNAKWIVRVSEIWKGFRCRCHGVDPVPVFTEAQYPHRFNWLRLWQGGRYFADGTFKCILLKRHNIFPF